MNEEAVGDYLAAEKMKAAARGTWGIGSMISKAMSKAMQATMAPHRVTDQIIAPKDRETAIRLIGELLPSNVLEVIDPARFSAEGVTFCALIGQRMPSFAPGTGDQLFMAFITVRALSGETSQVLIEVYAKGWFQAGTNAYLKRLRHAIVDRLT